MKRKLLGMGLVSALVLGGWLVWRALNPPTVAKSESNLIGDEFEIPQLGFEQVEDDYTWDFPADLGVHPRYQREVWELTTTGDCSIPLKAEFRLLNILPSDFPLERASEWAIQSIMTGTFTIKDGNKVLIDEISDSRVALDLAGADADQVWLEGWHLNWANGTFTLNAIDRDLTLNFSLDVPTPQSETDWYGYTQSGNIQGDIQLDDDTYQVDCAIELHHRFGTPSS
jgi:predicted secreted hydrolase